MKDNRHQYLHKNTFSLLEITIVDTTNAIGIFTTADAMRISCPWSERGNKRDDNQCDK